MNIQSSEPRKPKPRLYGVVLNIKSYPNSKLLILKENKTGLISKFIRVEKEVGKKISMFNSFLGNLEIGDKIQLINFVQENLNTEKIGWINLRTVIMPASIKPENIYCKNKKGQLTTVDSIQSLKLKYKNESQGTLTRFYESLIEYKKYEGNEPFSSDENKEFQTIKDFKRSQEFASHVNINFRLQKKEELKKHYTELENLERTLQYFMKNKEYEIYGWDKKQELTQKILTKKSFIEGYKKDYFV